MVKTNVPHPVQVAVVAPLGSPDHLSLSAAISMAKAVPNMCISRMVRLKHRVNRTAVCDARGELTLLSIWGSDNPVECLNVHLSPSHRAPPLN